MPTFVLERIVPPGFDVTDPGQVALHSRWAADAYRDANIVWLGGVATKGKMYSVLVADDRGDVERYLGALGVEAGEFALEQVVSTLGPQVAMSRDDPRYRATIRPVR
jgi:hypothetical protein